MKTHANARLTPRGRDLLCQRVLVERWTVVAAAEAAGVSARTGAKWLARSRAEGASGLSDRSSAPRRIPHRTPPERVEAIAWLRRLRLTGPAIAVQLAMACSTVTAVLARIGLNHLSRLDPALGVTVQEVMTDNGGAYRSHAHAAACRALRIRHLRTRPCRPRTNGKAERFIRTLLGGWAYAATYRDSAHLRLALSSWLTFYNQRRPHGALGRQAPAARLRRLTLNNVPSRVLRNARLGIAGRSRAR